MRPRTIIIIGIAVIIVVCIGSGAYFYFANNNGNSYGSGAGGATPAGAGQEVTLSASQILSNTPTTTLLTIGTSQGSVQVNNFYLSNPPVTDGGETVIIASTTDYLITYDTIDSSFWIGMDADQLNATRPAAEQAFLSALGVSSAAACKLNISEGVFYDASSSLSGQSFPLSFCPANNLNSVQ